MGLFQKLFGSVSEREVKKLKPIVDKIEALSEKYESVPDEDLQAMTQIFKDRLTKGETLKVFYADNPVRETSAPKPVTPPLDSGTDTSDNGADTPGGQDTPVTPPADDSVEVLPDNPPAPPLILDE